MKIALIIFIYLFIGFIISIIDQTSSRLHGDCSEYKAENIFFLCTFWIILLPIFFILILFKKLDNINYTVSDKIYGWIKKHERKRTKG